jgi:hypothetical protein
MWDTQISALGGSPTVSGGLKRLAYTVYNFEVGFEIYGYCRCPHRLNLSFQSSRSCALPNIKVLKDKGLEFANSIRRFFKTTS